MIFLEDGNKNRLAEHVATILITRKPFVFPREVELAPGETTFTVGVYHAFKANAPDPTFEFLDCEGDPFVLVDYQTPETQTVDYFRRGHEFTFEVPPELLDESFEEEIRLKMADPEQAFAVKVRRRASPDG